MSPASCLKDPGSISDDPVGLYYFSRFQTNMIVVSCLLLLVLSCLVCNCCWLAVCICCSYLMCICCTMYVLLFLL